MEFNAVVALMTPLDGVALGILIAVWFGIGWWIEHPGAAHPSVTVQMAEYRRMWMREFQAREVRIFDAQIVSSLRQGTSWFASTCLLALGGVLAMIGNAVALQGVAQQVADSDAPALFWQMKLALVAVFLTHGFLKFVWANRIFGYCSVMMAAVPNDPAHPDGPARASQAAELNIRAAWNFNRGLRSMYFALGALAWMVGPIALIAATCSVLWLLWSREFASVARSIVVEGVSE